MSAAGKLLRRPTLWLALVIAVATAVVLILRARGPLVRSIHPIRRDLEQHLVTSGLVRVPMRVQVSAQVGGLVVAVGTVEGQRVETGDLLVQLDDSAERAASAQAEAAVRQARARVDQLQRVGAIVTTEALRQTESTLGRAELELSRTEKLVASSALPAAELDTARTALAVARAQRTAAQAQQVAAAPLGADSRIALAALLQAQAQLEGARVRMAQTRLVAPHSGVVLTRTVEPGEVVPATRVLLVLAADGPVQLECHPDEKNLAWIRMGQQARASADAYPDAVFDATVSYIAPSIDAQRGSVEVHLDVRALPPQLRPDMTVSIDLTVAAKRAALAVPADAVTGSYLASPWVLVVVGGRAVRKDVRLGVRGEDTIEIVSGLSEADEVLLTGGGPITPGSRIRTESD